MKPRHPIQLKQPPRYFGKYRGIILSNVDPEQLGRVTAQVPAVLGSTPSGWALPCVPAAGPQSGIYIVPAVGSAVWVEFEGGDPDQPIWTGGFWPSVSAVPVLATSPGPIPPGQNIVIQTTGGNMVLVSDASPTPVSGGIILKSASGAMVIVNATGIYLNNGEGATINLVGPTVKTTG